MRRKHINHNIIKETLSLGPSERQHALVQEHDIAVQDTNVQALKSYFTHNRGSMTLAGYLLLWRMLGLLFEVLWLVVLARARELLVVGWLLLGRLRWLLLWL